MKVVVGRALEVSEWFVVDGCVKGYGVLVRIVCVECDIFEVVVASANNEVVIVRLCNAEVLAEVFVADVFGVSVVEGGCSVLSCELESVWSSLYFCLWVGDGNDVVACARHVFLEEDVHSVDGVDECCVESHVCDVVVDECVCRVVELFEFDRDADREWFSDFSYSVSFFEVECERDSNEEFAFCDGDVCRDFVLVVRDGVSFSFERVEVRALAFDSCSDGCFNFVVDCFASSVDRGEYVRAEVEWCACDVVRVCRVCWVSNVFWVCGPGIIWHG